MSITTYAELKTAIANWLEDSTLTSRIPEFIALAQAKLYRGQMGPMGQWIVPPLRIRDMVTTANITITSGTGSLPSGWLEFQRLWVDTAGRPTLKYLPAQTFYDDANAHETSGDVIYYTLEGVTIRTAPAVSDTIKSVHYAKFTAMSADGDADWVVTNAPHVYMHGALAEAWGYKLDGEQEAKHMGLFSQAVKALNVADSQAQRAGSQLVMRPGAVA